MPNEDQLIATLEHTASTSITFSLRIFRGKKYVAITKFLHREGNESPKPIGGVVFGTDVFLSINKLISEHTEDLLDPAEKVIGTIETKPGEEVRVSIAEHEGRVGIDLRKYVVAGETHTPTHKGIRVSIEEADTLVGCFDSVVAAIEEGSPK